MLTLLTGWKTKLTGDSIQLSLLLPWWHGKQKTSVRLHIKPNSQKSCTLRHIMLAATALWDEGMGHEACQGPSGQHWINEYLFRWLGMAKHLYPQAATTFTKPAKGLLKQQSASSSVFSMGTSCKQLWYIFSVADATNTACPLPFGPFLLSF